MHGPSARTTILALLGLLLASGCHRRSDANPTTAASEPTDAGAPDVAADVRAEAPRDRTLRPVGEAESTDFAPIVTSDRRVLFGSAMIFYEGKRDGTLPLVSDVKEQAKLLPDDDTLIGYVKRARGVEALAAGPDRTLLTTSFSGDGMRSLAMVTGERGRIAVTPVKSDATKAVRYRDGWLVLNERHELAWLEGAAALPKVPERTSIIELDTTTDGSLVALAWSAGTFVDLLAWPKSGEGEPRSFRLSLDAHKAVAKCSFVSTFAEGATVLCTSRDHRREVTSFHRWSGGKLEVAFEGAPSDVVSASVTREGSLVALREMDVAPLLCRASEKKCEPIPVEKDAGKSSGAAHYEWNATDVVDDRDRTWHTLGIGAPSDAEPRFTGGVVVAPAEDDVWVAARYVMHTVLLHSGGRADGQRTVFPSEVDARVLVQNESAPAAWTGHCEQIFVRLDGTTDEARALDVEGAKARLGEIKKALAVPNGGPDDPYFGPPFTWALVTGRLHDQRVVGVVVYRFDAEGKLDVMERATERLLDKLAKNPVSRPPAYCTLPVLDRRLAVQEL